MSGFRTSISHLSIGVIAISTVSFVTDRYKGLISSDFDIIDPLLAACDFLILPMRTMGIGWIVVASSLRIDETSRRNRAAPPFRLSEIRSGKKLLLSPRREGL